MENFKESKKLFFILPTSFIFIILSLVEKVHCIIYIDVCQIF